MATPDPPAHFGDQPPMPALGWAPEIPRPNPAGNRCRCSYLKHRGIRYQRRPATRSQLFLPATQFCQSDTDP